MAEDRARVLAAQKAQNELLMEAIVLQGPKTTDGDLVRAVGIPWFELIKQISMNPSFMYNIDWRRWEEILAGAYKQAGFDEVVLTPRSGDFGRDVIATKHGVLSIRIVAQMKRYSPGHLVSADEVRAMLGVVTSDQSASKAVISTTSDFAPGVRRDKLIAPYLPTRVELVPGPTLVSWLHDIASSSQPIRAR